MCNKIQQKDKIGKQFRWRIIENLLITKNFFYFLKKFFWRQFEQNKIIYFIVWIFVSRYWGCIKELLQDIDVL